MRRDTFWDQFRPLTQEKKMNKEELLRFMIAEFENANKEAMINSGITPDEADAKNVEYHVSIEFLLAQVVEKMFEKNIF